MQNKVLISRDHRSKYCNPNSPRHVGHYVSPIPDANSSIYDSDLQKHEKDLSLREEEYLIDLKKFYDGVEKHKKFRFELDEFRKQLKERVFTIEETEKQLKYIQQILDDRAKDAELIRSIAIPDYSNEAQALLELEEEVKNLESLLPKDPNDGTVTSVDKMHSDAQEMEINNSRLARELEQRKQKIEEQKKLLILENQNIEELEIEYENINRSILEEKSKFDALPKVNLKDILAQEKLKEDLRMRKQKVLLNSKDFQVKTSKAYSQIEVLQTEIQNLDKEFNELIKTRTMINDLLFQLRQANEVNKHLELLMQTADEKINQIKHSYENQRNDIYRMEMKKEALRKSSIEKAEKRKRLNEKENEIKDRREILIGIENQLNTSKQDLSIFKSRVSEIESEVEKYEKQAKLQIEKVNELQEQLQNKQDEIVDTPSTSSLQELKELIDKAESS